MIEIIWDDFNACDFAEWKTNRLLVGDTLDEIYEQLYAQMMGWA